MLLADRLAEVDMGASMMILNMLFLVYLAIKL
jgi:hypothetical protein